MKGDFLPQIAIEIAPLSNFQPPTQPLGRPTAGGFSSG
jgi:hypothetical protein